MTPVLKDWDSCLTIAPLTVSYSNYATLAVDTPTFFEIIPGDLRIPLKAPRSHPAQLVVQCPSI